MTMVLPEGYLGKGWHGVVTNYKSYRRARKFRLWYKKNTDYDFSIHVKPETVPTPYFIVPPIKWNEHYCIFLPDTSKMYTYSEIYNRAGNNMMGIEGMFTFTPPTKIPVCYNDSIGLIGTEIE